MSCPKTIEFKGVTYYSVPADNCIGCAFFNKVTYSNGETEGCEYTLEQAGECLEAPDNAFSQPNWLTAEDYALWRLTK